LSLFRQLISTPGKLITVLSTWGCRPIPEPLATTSKVGTAGDLNQPEASDLMAQQLLSGGQELHGVRQSRMQLKSGLVDPF
jgi:hypothetical protein